MRISKDNLIINLLLYFLDTPNESIRISKDFQLKLLLALVLLVLPLSKEKVHHYFDFYFGHLSFFQIHFTSWHCQLPCLLQLVVLLFN